MRRALLLLASMTAFGMPAGVVRAQAASTALQSAADPYAGLIAEAARRFGIPASWIRAVMRVESHGDPRAISPKGAMGLMQLMPGTWAELRARYGFGQDPFNPHDNVMAGAAFLREMHDRYGSPGFLAAYNAGPGRYEDYRDRHRPLPSETLAYVAELLPLLGGDRGEMPVQAAAFDPPAWSRASIFVVQSAGNVSADHAPSGQPSDDTNTVAAMRDLSAIGPKSTGLFVAVSSAGSKP